MGAFIGGNRRACAGLGLLTEYWWAWSLFADLLNAYLLWIPHYSSQWQAAGLLAAAMVLWPVLMPVALLALVTQLRALIDGLWLYSVKDKPCASNGKGSHGSWI